MNQHMDKDPLIRILKKHPADFIFGMLGVPMALAIANISRQFGLEYLASGYPLRTLFLAVVLSVEFGIATWLLICACDEKSEIWHQDRWRLRFTFLTICASGLALIFATISISPQASLPLGPSDMLWGSIDQSLFLELIAIPCVGILMWLLRSLWRHSSVPLWYALVVAIFLGSAVWVFDLTTMQGEGAPPPEPALESQLRLQDRDQEFELEHPPTCETLVLEDTSTSLLSIERDFGFFANRERLGSTPGNRGSGTPESSITLVSAKLDEAVDCHHPE